MFLETVYTPGVAALSYVLGDDGRAAVIDARRDCDVYIRIAGENEVRITHIFETHRHEDFLVGSRDLARKTGARIYHGHALDFAYGEPVAEGNLFQFGAISLRVLETPGHSHESISLVMSDTTFGDLPAAVFTGDALFVGDVGRTDFYSGQDEQSAQALYDSVWGKLIPLGDGVLVHPAHGAGSVCGMNMSPRRVSTLGYERQNNRALAGSREEFVRRKLSEHQYKPPYFGRMRRLNREGPMPLEMHVPDALQPGEFMTAMDAGMAVVDVRSPEAYVGTAVPGSFSIPLEMLSAFAGWLLPYEADIGIVAQGQSQVGDAVLQLGRLGYERVSAYLAGGMEAWESSGRDTQSIDCVQTERVLERLESGEKFTLLDVRMQAEFEADHLPDALNIFLGELPRRVKEMPAQRPVTCLCDTGRRAAIAASVLKRAGVEGVEVCLGSMSAVNAIERRRGLGVAV